MKPLILWCGDAACPSGFARATHGILETVRQTCDVGVLALNYRGDPHDWPYKIWVAQAEGDWMGINRIAWMCDTFVKEYGRLPDIVVIQNDPWNIPFYTKVLKETHPGVALVGAIAVDGKNLAGGAELNKLDHAVFWTKFALEEARLGGYEGPASVVPLGVDLETYKPQDKWQSRRRRFGNDILADAFIVGNVNRNQPRKRWDLTLQYFSEWVYGGTPVEHRRPENRQIQDAWLYLHVAPTGDTGIGVKQLSRYYAIWDRIALVQPQTFYGIDEDDMRETYNCFDVSINTGQGEGFGLTAIEAMACGVPVIAPDWAAFGDWGRGAMWLVPCTSTCIGPPYVNVIGGVPDMKQFVLALNRLYSDRAAREQNGKAAFERANEPRFRWENIGEAWAKILHSVVKKQHDSIQLAEAR